MDKKYTHSVPTSLCQLFGVFVDDEGVQVNKTLTDKRTEVKAGAVHSYVLMMEQDLTPVKELKIKYERDNQLDAYRIFVDKIEVEQWRPSSFKRFVGEPVQELYTGRWYTFKFQE